MHDEFVLLLAKNFLINYLYNISYQNSWFKIQKIKMKRFLIILKFMKKILKIKVLKKESSFRVYSIFIAC